jgi:hypothetical protein
LHGAKIGELLIKATRAAILMKELSEQFIIWLICNNIFSDIHPGNQIITVISTLIYFCRASALFKCINNLVRDSVNTLFVLINTVPGKPNLN